MKQSHTASPASMTRAEKRRRRRRRLMLRRTLIVAVALLLLAAIVWGVIEIAKASKGQTTTFLGVKAIEVECVDGEGTVRYPAEEIIRASGIYLDQSLLALNKVQASERVLAQFPYLDFVEVKNTSFSTVCIRVAEAQVLAAAQMGEQWLIVGDNNHVLEVVATEALPAGLVRIKGAKPLTDTLGDLALEERELRICKTLVGAMQAADMTDITVIDMAQKTDLRLWWKDRLEIILGNESNLPAQVTAFKTMLPTLLEKNGENAAGQLNMTSYADDNDTNDRAVYTPADAIRPPSTTGKPAEGDSTTATDASADGSTTATTAGTTAGTTVADAA